MRKRCGEGDKFQPRFDGSIAGRRTTNVILSTDVIGEQVDGVEDIRGWCLINFKVIFKSIVTPRPRVEVFHSQVFTKMMQKN